MSFNNLKFRIFSGFRTLSDEFSTEKSQEFKLFAKQGESEEAKTDLEFSNIKKWTKRK